MLGFEEWAKSLTAAVAILGLTGLVILGIEHAPTAMLFLSIIAAVTVIVHCIRGIVSCIKVRKR